MAKIMTPHLITTLLALSFSLSQAKAESTGLTLNQAQSQFPTIYLPSVGSVNRNQFKLPDDTPNAPKLRVEAFDFAGVKSIDVDHLHNAFAPFEKRSFTPQQLLEMTDLVVDTYREHDIAAVARIPPQDPKSGTILFEIHESTFAGVVLDYGFEEEFNVSLERVEALGGLQLSEEGPLILSERERQQLLTIDMHGISVSGGLQANDDGDQELELWIENSARFSGTLDVNNAGLSATGEEQFVLTSMFYSPFNRGGAGYLNAIKTDQSNYLSISHRGPIGYRGTAFDLQAASLYANSKNTKQKATSLSAGVRHTLIRSLANNLFISGIWEQRSLQENPLPNSSVQLESNYKVDTLKITLDGNRAFQKDRLTYRLETTLGDTDLNNSPNRADDLANANTQGRFNILSGFLKYRKPLNSSWHLQTELYGQMSNKNLDDSQRFVAGGAQGLRAFTKSELIVDQGALIRFDLVKQLSDKWHVGGFADWASVEKRAKNRNFSNRTLESDNRITAYNWGLTAGYKINDSLRLDSSLAQALSTSDSLMTEQGDLQARLNLNWAF